MVEDRGIDVLETGLAREAVIGDEDVHRSERRLDIVDQLFWSIGICHVRAERTRRPAAGNDLGSERLGRLSVAAVGNSEPRDIAGEPPADRATDTAAGSLLRIWMLLWPAGDLPIRYPTAAAGVTAAMVNLTEGTQRRPARATSAPIPCIRRSDG